MTLINMCNNCPHNPMRNKVVGGAEVVPDWLQYIKDTFWNKPELSEPPEWFIKGLTNAEVTHPKTFSQQEQYKREIEEFVSYKNRNLLKTIGELPAEYRPIFKNMFEELTKQIVEAKMESI